MEPFNSTHIAPGQPVFTPPVPVKRSLWPKILIAIILIILVALGVVAYMYRYELLESSWRHNMNRIEKEYSENAEKMRDQFDGSKAIESGTFASSTPEEINEYVSIMEKTILSLNNASGNADEGVKNTTEYLEKLSPEDSKAKNLYQDCFEGRKKGLVFIKSGLSNMSKGLQAFSLLQKFSMRDFKKSQESLLAVFSQMKAGKLTGLQTYIETAKTDLRVSKGDIDSIVDMLGFDSYRSLSSGLQLFIDSMDDVSASIPKQDVSLLYKAVSKIQKAGTIIQQNSDKLATDWKDWIEKEVIANYKSGEAEINATKNACKEAEVASQIDKENTSANLFVRKYIKFRK